MRAFVYCLDSVKNFPFPSETPQTTNAAVKQAGPLVLASYINPQALSVNIHRWGKILAVKRQTGQPKW